MQTFPRAVVRGVGQVFFQESALSGAIFLVGIAISSPAMAIGGLFGSVIGTCTAWLWGFDEDDRQAGIFGFNSTLVGIATLFFFEPQPLSLALLVGGCIAASFLTRTVRTHLAFPTYTAPFVVTTWVVYVLAHALGATEVAAGSEVESGRVMNAVANGVAQVMFQANLWTGALFVIGIAVSNWRHAVWVVLASLIGMLVGSYHLTPTLRALDVERLVERAQSEIVALGLYGYNATLAAVALYLWRRSLIAPLLGVLLTVPIAEAIPLVGLPALTAPFVLATWIVLALGEIERRVAVGSDSH